MLNFAIAGCGAIGTRHAVQAAAMGNLLAICDKIEGRAEGVRKTFGANAYNDLEDMLRQEKDLDVIAICTPNGLHAEHSIMALKAGLHVICEKPMALRSKDCSEMIGAANVAGKHLFVVKQNRFNPPVVWLRQMLDEEKLGRIYSIQVSGCWNRSAEYYRNSWHGTLEMDGGILFTQFSHFIDLMYWMIGDVKEASAFSDNFSNKGAAGFADTVTSCLRFENGVIGSLHFTINSYSRNMEGSLTIIGEKGTVKIGGQYLNKLEYCQVEENSIAEPGPANPPNDYGYYRGSMSNHDKIYRHVVEVVTEGKPNRFSGYEGLKTVEIIEKIYKSAK